MAMIDWVDRRLHNWARYREGGLDGGLGYARVNLMTVGSGGPAVSVIPTNAMEANETGEAIKTLPADLVHTVELYYRRTANRKELASMLGCAQPTVDSRLTRAHRMLADWFNDRAAEQQRVRDDLERTTREARQARGF